MSRREFTRDVKAQIVKRAMLPSGEIACESCGLILTGKKFHIDHTKPDGLEVDKTRRLTAADGQLLGIECCHTPKTKIDVAVISKAKRTEAKHLGIAARPKQKIPSRPNAPKRAPKPSLPPRPLFKPIEAQSHD